MSHVKDLPSMRYMYGVGLQSEYAQNEYCHEFDDIVHSVALQMKCPNSGSLMLGICAWCGCVRGEKIFVKDVCFVETSGRGK